MRNCASWNDEWLFQSESPPEPHPTNNQRVMNWSSENRAALRSQRGQAKPIAAFLFDNPDDEIPAAPLTAVGDVRLWRESCPLAARIRYYDDARSSILS